MFVVVAISVYTTMFSYAVDLEFTTLERCNWYLEEILDKEDDHLYVCAETGVRQ
jgi:hypothetical protein